MSASRSASTNEENLDSIRQVDRRGRPSGREAMLDCEHFFDGYKANPAYALELRHGRAGRRRALGRALRHQWRHAAARGRARSSREVAKHVPADKLGIHTHNDTENAVANTLAAVRAGARQIQGTLNGLGERCGNANLTSLIPTLLLKSSFADTFSTAVTPDRLRHLTHASRVLDEVLNRAPNRQAPYVGESAFATKAGIHASAIVKDPRDLRACAARSRSAISAACWCPIKAGARMCWPSSSASASTPTRTIRASRACSTR